MKLFETYTSNQSTSTEPERIFDLRPVQTHKIADRKKAGKNQKGNDWLSIKGLLHDEKNTVNKAFYAIEYFVSTHKQVAIYMKSRIYPTYIRLLNVFGNQPKTLPINKMLYKIAHV